MTAHTCHRLALCVEHPRWMVVREFRVGASPQFSGRPWWVYRPGADLTVGRFATHAEAVTYATAQAKADQLAAIRANIAAAISAHRTGIRKPTGYDEGWDDALDIAEQIALGELR